MTAVLTDEQCDAISDAVLRADGSGLRYYTMPKSLAEIRNAVRRSTLIITEVKDADRD